MGIVEALWDGTTQCVIVNDLADALHTLAAHTNGAVLIGTDTLPTLDPSGKIAGYYQTVAEPHTHSFTLTFCVLSAMYLFPACRAEIEQSTPVNYALYFSGDHTTPDFERRFERHLAGSDTHQAKTPAEIVIAERQLLMAM
jgi:hypothetical protein